MIYLKDISTLVAILLLFTPEAEALLRVCVRGLSVQVMSQRLPRLDDGRVLHTHVRPLELCESRGGCAVLIQCCFTSTETMKLIRDGESRTATSTFTQLLSTSLMLLYIRRDLTAYQGRVAHDGHLDFPTPPELSSVQFGSRWYLCVGESP